MEFLNLMTSIIPPFSKYLSKLGQKTSMAGIYSASYIVEYQNKLYYSGYHLHLPTNFGPQTR